MGRPLALGGRAVSVVAVVVMLLLGRDPGEIADMLANSQQQHQDAPSAPGGQADQLSEFVSVVLASTEDTWPAVLRSERGQYIPPKLVLFTDVVPTACGTGESAMGPFYCPGDSKVYLDLSFFAELERMGGPGDFAQAYVIAHEIGHHVQNLLGTSEITQRQMQRMDKTSSNALSVKVELQADCFAGIWAHHANRQSPLIEPGDVEEGLGAAAAIGDDRLQRQSGRRVVPESFTHGSSAQRVSWFKRGLEQGTLEACNTLR